MKTLALLGLLAGLHAPHHHHRYWWWPTDTCTVQIGVKQGVVFDTIPYVQCVPVRGGWHDTPQHLAL